jgi:hypothetical protein
MKIRQLLLAGVTVMLLGTGNAWAQLAPSIQLAPDPAAADSTISLSRAKPKPPKAPEIDAASGTSAIALLTGILLLVAERSRSRRT